MYGVIFEAIQGVGGLDEPTTDFVKQIEVLCNKHNVCIIADEVQSGFGRSGDFFAFQKYMITPHIISIAKGMGNGFPVGGILVNPSSNPNMGCWERLLGEITVVALHSLFCRCWKRNNYAIKPRQWANILSKKQKHFLLLKQLKVGADAWTRI